MAAVVARIDEEVAVVPRGAYMKTPLGDVVLNKSFQGYNLEVGNRENSITSTTIPLFFFFFFVGLPLGEAKRLNYYFHFRLNPADDDNKKVCIQNPTKTLY